MARHLIAVLCLAVASTATAQAESFAPSLQQPLMESPSVSDALARRNKLRTWHIVFGNLTWAAANATTILGIIQYRDRYGGGHEAETPCARGDAIMDRACSGNPVAHAISATLLLSFYTASLSIGAAMPDPLHAADGPSRYARRLRRHRAIRWALLGMLAAQTVLGAVAANLDDFSSRRALASVHLGLGIASWGTMTAMGVYGSLMAY